MRSFRKSLKANWSNIGEDQILKQRQMRVRMRLTLCERFARSEWVPFNVKTTEWTFSFGKWKSWKRCRGSVLQAYLKKECSRSLQILWWILCCGDNWYIVKTEKTRYLAKILSGVQQVKKLVYLRLVCYFSVKGVIGISSPLYLAGMFLFSRDLYCTNFCQFVLPYYIKTDRY